MALPKQERRHDATSHMGMASNHCGHIVHIFVASLGNE